MEDPHLFSMTSACKCIAQDVSVRLHARYRYTFTKMKRRFIYFLPCTLIHTHRSCCVVLSQLPNPLARIARLEELKVEVLIPRHKLLSPLLKHIAEEEVAPQRTGILVRTDPNLVLFLDHQASEPSCEDPQRPSLDLSAHVPPRVEKRLTVFVLRLVPWRSALRSRGKRWRRLVVPGRRWHMLVHCRIGYYLQ